MTTSAVGARRGRAGADAAGHGGEPARAGRSLIVTGAIAAAAAAASGLAVITLLVVIGWIAAPHGNVGLPAVLRAAAAIWLVGHHVGFTLRGAGQIGMLPLGLVLLPGALLWRAGRWVVRVGQIQSLRHVGYAALALAVPYSMLTGALALASRSSVGSASLAEAWICGLLLALTAGGLGGARALARWPELIGLLPERARFCVLAVAGVLATLIAAGALLAGAALTTHLRAAAGMEAGLAPGTVGILLLLLLQLGYLPNAIAWAISFSLGPGFAFGTATVVAPTGSALARLPAFPMLAALPPGPHGVMPGWLGPMVLVLPYLAGAIGGLLLVRAAPPLALDAAPVWGLACGGLAGILLGVLAAFSGGPLGDGRLAAVGPSGWQVGVVSALEIGVAAAVTAGAANWLSQRRTGSLRQLAGSPHASSRNRRERDEDPVGAGHLIYVDPWAGDPRSSPQWTPRGPSALP